MKKGPTPLAALILLSIFIVGIFLLPYTEDTTSELPQLETRTQSEQAQNTETATTTLQEEHPLELETSALPEEIDQTAVIIKAEVPTKAPEITQEEAVTKSFYNSPTIPFDTLNETTLPAVVNILCGTNGQSSFNGATGSGVIIDPRGIILTNAHVAQYVLLQNYTGKPFSCVIRTGMPAETKYVAEVIAFPYAWAEKHAGDFRLEAPTGTGEDDWALLYITKTTNGASKPTSFPFIFFDPRQDVTTTNDGVLIAAYPAGFLGSAILKRDLWPVSTIVTIQKVYTFTESLIDILSLGGNIVAQGGASGGAVVNQWGKLIGIIVTSSIGNTTAERDLRAVTISHINRSIQKETGTDLLTLLQEGSFEEKIKTFVENSEPQLFSFYSL